MVAQSLPTSNIMAKVKVMAEKKMYVKMDGMGDGEEQGENMHLGLALHLQQATVGFDAHDRQTCLKGMIYNALGTAENIGILLSVLFLH